MTTPNTAAQDDASTEAPQGGQVPGGADGFEAFAIPRALAQATLDYLAAQPYREVFALVRGFEALEPLPPAGDRPAE